jgi:ABC-type uncharacterized transport system permease subunit
MSKLLLLASLGYLSSSVILLARLKGFWLNIPRIIPLLLAVTAVSIHGLLLSTTIMNDRGVHIGLGVSLSMAGWLAALLIVASSINKPVESLGMLIFPFSLVSLWLAAWLPPPHPIAFGLGIHVLVSLIAYTLLSLAAAQATLIWIQEYRLRHRQWQGLVGALPPLAMMEHTLFEWLLAGFIALSLTLFTGAVFIEDFLAQHLAHKTLFTVITWIMLALLLWGHWQRGWRGQRAAKITLWGYGLLVLGFAGSQFVLEVLLG